ncbi:MAG: hypothetical protein JXB62_11840 [Pirellulales bacterium]|nr:hypothetical protein [Pirellulales bacterium]
MANRLLSLVSLLILSSSATVPSLNAQSTSLQADQYALRPEALSQERRQQLYLRLIENFVGWAEHSGRFVETGELEEEAGYFDAAGHGVTWARGNSNLCLAYAVLLGAYPQRREFSIYRVPRSRLESHLRHTIRALCLSNKNCSRHKPSRRTWGGPSWQAALELIGCAWAAHLYREHLDVDTLAMVREVVCREADHLERKIPSRRFNNTGAEDCCWNTPLLAFAANRYADDPRASRWDSLGKKWAFNAASIAADARSEKVVDGRPLKDWIVSENLHPDLTLENHAMWSVGYQCCQQHFGEAELAYRLFGQRPPSALAHHADEMWRKVTGVLYLWDGDILFPHGQDWSWKVYSSIEYLCWQNCCRGNKAAAAFESRALQMVYRRQLALGTGDLGAAVSKTLDFGNQTVKPKRWAFCYLMHKQFDGAEPISFSEAEEAALGFHLYAFTKVAIHRTREKCVSVSWHPRHQPIYVLPEGNSTFAEPPFFFPYDRDSGCARVEVARQDVPVTSKHDNPRHPADFLADSGQEYGAIARFTAPNGPRLLEVGHKDEAKAELAVPDLHEAQTMPDGKGMRVSYRRPCPGAVVQYMSIVSLPDEATVYCTAFRANQRTTVKIGPLFPLRAAAPPGFERPIRQHRGVRWLNMSDHVGFVSVDPLPEEIPSDRFLLTEGQTYSVQPGEWFGRAALVVYARQSRAQTARTSLTVRLLNDSCPGKVTLALDSSGGTSILEFDFAGMTP